MKATLTKNIPTVDLYKKMIAHFESYGFWHAGCNNRSLGCNGELVKDHLRNEWMLANMILSDEPVFKTSESVEKAFTYGRQLGEKLPFSVISVGVDEFDGNASGKDVAVEDVISKYFNPKAFTIIKKILFCSPEESTSYFHKQQRERKIWWRKFSALPGRFSLTEVTSNESNMEQQVEILAEFPWKMELVETVRCIKVPPFKTPESFQVKEGTKNITPHIVTNEFRLEVAASVYICDAYDKIYEETDRDIVRFHRKIAPFKVAFAASASSANVAKELADLALVLARKIRKCGIGCLLLPDLTKSSLESQYLRSDALGIPYTIVLNDKTLQEGMIGIRSRDTTLKEQSHIGVVVPYIEKIMKSY